MTDTAATMPLARIKPGGNPRRFFSPAKHDELVNSLRLRGMLQPILLRPGTEPDSFAIVAGERRYRAALDAFGADGSVPVIVRDLTDQEALEAAIDENDVREDASETEQADAAVRVLAACQNDRAEAAKRLGWSTAKLDRRLALAGLSDAVKSALDERRIKVGHAELLAAVPTDKQEKALETILSADIDVAKTRELLMRMTQNLAAATFDKTECASCGYNSARQCALFETHVDDGHCTNGACFALKTETAEKARAEAQVAAAPSQPEAPSDSGEAGGENTPAAVPGDARPSTPDSSPAPRSGQGSAPTKASAPAKPKVTVQGLADKMAETREKAWRKAVADAFADSADHLRICLIAEQAVRSGQPIHFATVAGYADEFEVDLRSSWRVDGDFLAQLSKDELKFVAQECGLVEHTGEKAFAKLLAVPVSDLITGLLHVTGFDWAGRLPSCITLDGKVGVPGDVTTPETATEKD
ncbi:MAG: PRTRC system ParB family protein [Sphingomonadales bacterium]|nr:PRTRC system ParB family protein [Sphingomonadales bacterium]